MYLYDPLAHQWYTLYLPMNGDARCYPKYPSVYQLWNFAQLYQVLCKLHFAMYIVSLCHVCGLRLTKIQHIISLLGMSSDYIVQHHEGEPKSYNSKPTSRKQQKHGWIQRERQGFRTPWKYSKTDPYPIKIHTATKPAFNVWSSWARQRNAILMAFAGGPMKARLSGILILSSLIN